MVECQQCHSAYQANEYNSCPNCGYDENTKESSNFAFKMHIAELDERLDGMPDAEMILFGHVKGVTLYDKEYDGTDNIAQAVEMRIPLTIADIRKLIQMLRDCNVAID